MKETKFIFVTGGVVSGLGKGISAASIGRLLKSRGLKVFMQKFDPYINVDPGTMSPLQHGEVFVTKDGAETDLDLGHYERFIDENLNKHSSVTAGKIYLKVIEKERNMEYDGKTVQVIPHITNEIKEAIFSVAKSSDADVVITEIGGTVGDFESLPFIEAIRQMRRDVGYNNTFYIHTTLVPYLKANKELKTKPTQHSVKELRSLGINPDMILLRTEKQLTQEETDKVALFCDVDKEAVIQVVDCKILYEVVMEFAKQHVDEIFANHSKITLNGAGLDEWVELVKSVKKTRTNIKIGIVGKYVSLPDAYLSVVESLHHAGYATESNVSIQWIDAQNLSSDNIDAKLEGLEGILVPGGFGKRASSGKLLAIEYARKNQIPFFGICLGLQLAMIEYARNVLQIKGASTTEMDPDCQVPLFKINPDNQMRLGEYKITLNRNSRAHSLYNQEIIFERHRHRYEFNLEYLSLYEQSNLKVSAFSDSGVVEMVELDNHPFFVACQFHPEFASRPNRAQPIFKGFLEAVLKRK